jgi:zinc/manganese transport system substrate-binding protein
MGIVRFIAALGLLIATPTAAFAQVNVFACEPEWAALATEIGGDKVEAFAATTAQEDPHHVRARPSLLAAMRRADLVVCSGAGLEIGWLPILLQKAGNAKVQPGAPGHVEVAEHVAILERPVVVDRSLGDIHPEGNPHLHLDPRNVARAAEVVAGRLGRIDVANAAYYGQRIDAFRARWMGAIRRWESNAATLRGMPVVVHHKSWTYLIHWLGLNEVATLEAKPGIPPTASHLSAVLQAVRGRKVGAILRTPYDPADASQWLSGKSGVPAVVLPYTVGGDAKSRDLFSLFDETLALLAAARVKGGG